MSFYDSIKLEKGMYKTGNKSFTQNLEALDPSENYENTEFAGLDAFERQLKRFDIKVGGRNSDVIDKFFQTSDSAVLFPEYIVRAVKQGIEENNVLPSIVATVTNIEGLDYRGIVSEDEADLPNVAEGAAIPATKIRTQENLIKLNKRGRMLQASYEALRFQHLDLFTVSLKRIGAYIAKAQLEDAVNVLLNGDGNNNAAAGISSATADTLTYADIVKLWASLAPYELNTMLAPTATMQKILNLSEMKDSQAGLNFQGTGKLVTPVGATLIHVPSISADTIIGIDKNCALEMVQAGDVVIDYDRLIDRQLERASVSTTIGFAKIFKDATKKLTY